MRPGLLHRAERDLLARAHSGEHSDRGRRAQAQFHRTPLEALPALDQHVLGSDLPPAAAEGV